ELAREGVAFDRNLPIGVMIETPSAALSTDHLAKSSSFFSIGTNDLIQYTFAADRENEDVAHLYHPLHPAVLRLLKSAIDGANGAAYPSPSAVTWPETQPLPGSSSGLDCAASPCPLA